MTLKIEHNVAPLQIVGGAQALPAKQENTGVVPPSSGGHDRVTLTSSAMDLQAMANGAGESFNADRVESLKAAIANGSYTIDPERIANGLMRSEQDLGGW